MNSLAGKIILLAVIAAMNSGGAAADLDIVDLIPQQLYNHRSLQLLPLPSCNDYQYIVQIRDDLRMSYVVTDDRIKVELEYDGEAWIGLGTNPDREGKMVGAEAWIALPAAAERPSIYNMNGKRINRVNFATNQTLENGLVSQTAGVTLMQFDKLLNDGNNVAIDGNGNVVFIWAIGGGNPFGRHAQRGAFRIDLNPCTTPSSTPEEVEPDVVCGLLGLGIFCPISRCGLFVSLIGLC